MTTVAERSSARIRFGAVWVVAISSLQVLTIATEVGAPLQPLISVLFVATCPGFFILDVDKPHDPSARLLIGLTSSLAINVVVFTMLVVTDARWLAPIFAIVLVVAAVLPRRRLESALSAMSTVAPEAPPETYEDQPAYVIEGPETLAPGDEAASYDYPEPATTEPEEEEEQVAEPVAEPVDEPATATAADTEHPDSEAEQDAVPPQDSGAAVAASALAAEDQLDDADQPAAADQPTAAGEAAPTAAPEATAEDEAEDQPEAEPEDAVLPEPAAGAGPAEEAPADRAEPLAADQPPDVARRPEEEPEETYPEVASTPSVPIPHLGEEETPEAEAASPQLDDGAATGPDGGPQPSDDAQQPLSEELELDIPMMSRPIDLNTATVEQLATLPGVGPSLAARIVAHRDEHGPFHSIAGVLDVPGIGRGKLTGFVHLVELDRDTS